jgi:hypothetical protein
MTGAGIPLHRDVLRLSLPHADIDTIKWIIRRSAATTDDATKEELFLFSIHAGRRDVMEFLYEHHHGGGLPPTGNLRLYTRTAAEMGFLDVLRCLRMWGCAWDHTTIENALMNEHIAVARWAVENGCPLTSATSAISTSEEVYLRRLIIDLAAGNAPPPSPP